MTAIEANQPGRHRQSIILAACVALLHFQILAVGGFPVTVALPALAVWMALNLDHRRHPWALIACLTLLVLPIGVYLSTPDASPTEFLRTFALFLLVIAALWHVAARPNSEWRLRATDNSLLAVLTTISAISVLQNISGRLGNDTFFNIFGTHQYLYEYQPNLEFGLVRAQGLYLEPSYNALVLIVLASILLLRSYKPRMVVIVTVAGLLATLSFAGLIWLFLVSTIMLVFHKGAPIARAFLFSTLVVLAAATFPYLSQRITSLDEAGSSANFRLVGPIELLSHVLAYSPFGAPLGSANNAVTRLGLLNGATTGSSLDNGYYLVIYYFGWVGVGLCIAYAVSCLMCAMALRKGQRTWWPVSLCAVLLPAFTGGVMSPEFLVLALLLWTEIRASIRNVGVTHAYAAASIRSHGLQERPPGIANHGVQPSSAPPHG